MAHQTSSCSESNSSLPYIELGFPVMGNAIPADHNYALYAAIKNLLPNFIQESGVSIYTIAGMPDKRGTIHLSDRSRMQIRLPSDKVPLAYPLAGKQIYLGIHPIRLGIPQINMLQPATKLRSRLVTIKGYQEPESFLEAAQRQLEKLEIRGTPVIPTRIDGERDRKTIKIKRFTVVGFGLEVQNLNEEDSIRLQQYGIGGKRKMGCGIFMPVRENNEV
jgi:CRISPR-associated protein Cas6